ncbi:flagellar basal body-associated FliL family protein [Tabrizicola piscis]|uniref:Flagellar basal body-associated FliL family protein n=1 Tax=Tabrizicola piscis TaxID=2494374 RepID=A0A3S8U775_9RHOB|nr:flagellar basal body-associated FliL family protein [Tabrizicola piscis]AZL59454.1 flagellar basal body-associated FliL family protein [Tabrizicola piscis]
MMRKLFPIVLAVAGLGAGIGAGLWLRPDHEESDTTEKAEDAAATADVATDTGAAPEFVKLSNQFVVPVVDQGRVAAMVVLSLSLEVEEGESDAVFAREPKLRDMFLQVLFDHANVGGFSGSFTDGSNLIVLRNSLKEAASLVLGTVVKDVLIIDIARQDS